MDVSSTSLCLCALALVCFFFNDTAPTEIYTLSLHDALPIFHPGRQRRGGHARRAVALRAGRSEEHTSELQSHLNLVCRLLLEKTKAQVLTAVALEDTIPSACLTTSAHTL